MRHGYLLLFTIEVDEYLRLVFHDAAVIAARTQCLIDIDTCNAVVFATIEKPTQALGNAATIASAVRK